MVFFRFYSEGIGCRFYRVGEPVVRYNCHSVVDGGIVGHGGKGIGERWSVLLGDALLWRKSEDDCDDRYEK